MPQPPLTLSRRRFVGTAAGVAALSATGVRAAFLQGGEPLPARAIGRPMPGGVRWPDSPPPAPKEGSVGVAVIGLGGYALGQMMPALTRAEDCHLAAVVSGNADKAGRAAEAYGLPEDAIYSYDTFDRIAEDDRVDAVYIILPSGLHADWAERGFAAGKHVLCEKPMALTAEECERMIAASHRAERRLMIGYRCHFEPFNLRAMELMRDGAVGPIRTLRTEQTYVMGRANTPATNWRNNAALAGGGPLEDYGIYGLQSALYLSGEMPTAVSALAARPDDDPRFSQIYSHVVSQFTFPSGAVAQLSTSYDAAGNNEAEVRGAGGVLLMNPATGYGGQTMTLTKGRNEQPIDPGNPRVQFERMLDHFAAAIRNGGTIKTPGEMGLRDVRLMEAIYRASEEGRRIALNPNGTMQG